MRDCKKCKHLVMFDYKNRSYSCEARGCGFEPEEQEPILDKIRAEIIEMRSKRNCSCSDCLDIIDKYKADRSEEDGAST